MRLADLLVGISGLLLAGCGSEAEPAPAATQTAAATRPPPPQPAATPDLAQCQKRELLEEGLRERTRAIPVPAALRRVMRSDMDNFAVSTLGSATVCVDASWMEEVSDAALAADGRFVSFGWVGYEAYGHILVDRAGSGTVIDTGNAPVFSPSGKLVAGLQVSEAGWGGLEGFAIWEATPTGLSKRFNLVADEDGLLPEVFQAEFADWRIDRWVGEDCLAISAVAWDALDPDDGHGERAARTLFHSARADGWEIKRGPPPAGCRRA